MPPKIQVKCTACQRTDTLLWHPIPCDGGDGSGGQICQECCAESGKRQSYSPEAEDNEVKAKQDSTKMKEVVKEEAASPATAESSTTVMQRATSETTMNMGTAEEKRLRKSTRATRSTRTKSSNPISTTTSNGNNTNNTGNSKNQSKGRNRRTLFKKVPIKTPITQATVRVVQSLFYKGFYMQIGDIVSLVDPEENVYYAQIRGLLIDSYCEKSAFLTWLIPTQSSPDPRERFDPATYLIGPDEELSRKISCLEFVMHAPSNYYLDRSTPYPLPDIMDTEKNKRSGYIWTTLREYRRRRSVT